MTAPQPRDGAAATGGARALLVVVLDEDDDACRILQAWLQAHEMRVVCAPDPESAERVLDGARADVLVCELLGRGAFGHPLARTARAREVFRDTPLLVHTSRVGDDHRRQASDCGAVAFLAKPSDLPTVLAAVRRAADARPALVVR
jgi:CheY-like chemotaxis protein